ncbi:hypothetical protein CXF80_12105 [Shewanella sp. Actino-trap-3]|uniref:hypothetical protein n=1 Tax=Shewanella sp. Actino-trap-3 TaxID=2058331 RepID=UPI000C34FC1C|nr:hypothetical protein [Shewanella sp. Actino-trap-3]PKG78991.1 hypothetical protein CXF80_12105 [Shewanella sp. Actino-trap-3]
MGLKSNAYASTMQGVAGAINSSKTLVYSACTISTDCDEKAAVGTAAVETGNGLGNSLIVLGQSITLAYGYPRHTGAGIARMTNIADISDGGEFILTTYTDSGRLGIGIRLMQTMPPINVNVVIPSLRPWVKLR